LANSAEGSADTSSGDDDMSVAAAAGGAGAAVGVLALLAFAFTRRRRSAARDLVDDLEASIAPPPRSNHGSMKLAASQANEYEVPAVAGEAERFESAVYDMVDTGIDATYEIADGETPYTDAMAAEVAEYSLANNALEQTYAMADSSAVSNHALEQTYAMADSSAVSNHAVYHTAAATLRRESHEVAETLRRSSHQLELAMAAPNAQ